MKRLMLLALCITVLYSCNNSGAGGDAAAGGEQFDPSGFITEDIPGTPYQRVVKMSEDGKVLEDGRLHNGVKEGTWVVYQPDGIFPEKIISYAAGMYNGPYMEFNQRGQLSLKAAYQNNVLHGPWGKYRFGRPETEAFYKNGQLDGAYREYSAQTGKLIKEVNYKDGQQHGMLRFFNDAGEVTLEYEYQNGEKVGGGIVEEAAAGAAENAE